MNNAVKLKKLLAQEGLKKGVVIQSGDGVMVSFGGEILSFPQQNNLAIGDDVFLKDGVLSKTITPTSFFDV
jgi:hypothetical protein